MNDEEKEKIIDEMSIIIQNVHWNDFLIDVHDIAWDILYYRALSEHITNYINLMEYKKGNNSFDYAKLSDDDAVHFKSIILKSIVFIPPSELFCNVKNNASSDSDFNKSLKKIFCNLHNSLIASNKMRYEGQFERNLNSRKLGELIRDRNRNLIEIMNAISNIKIKDFDYYDELLGLALIIR